MERKRKKEEKEGEGSSHRKEKIQEILRIAPPATHQGTKQTSLDFKFSIFQSIIQWGGCVLCE